MVIQHETSINDGMMNILAAGREMRGFDETFCSVRVHWHQHLTRWVAFWRTTVLVLHLATQVALLYSRTSRIIRTPHHLIGKCQVKAGIEHNSLLAIISFGRITTRSKPSWFKSRSGLYSSMSPPSLSQIAKQGSDCRHWESRVRVALTHSMLCLAGLTVVDILQGLVFFHIYFRTFSCVLFSKEPIKLHL